MAVDIVRLKKALEVLSVGEGGEVYRRGAFCDVFSDMADATGRERNSKGDYSGKSNSVYRQLCHVNRDVCNIETILSRLDWQQGLWSSGTLDNRKWSAYTEADIHLFHVELQSIFDHVAKILAEIAPEAVTKELPFTKACEWIIGKDSYLPDPTHRNRLGEDSAKLIDKSAGWFRIIQGVRNQYAHHGAEAMTFIEKPKILFQVHDKRGGNLVNMPEVMYNANVADFKLYGGICYGYLLDFLEDCAEVIYKYTQEKRHQYDSRSNHFGIDVAKRWIENVIDGLDKPS